MSILDIDDMVKDESIEMIEKINKWIPGIEYELNDNKIKIHAGRNLKLSDTGFFIRNIKGLMIKQLDELNIPQSTNIAPKKISYIQNYRIPYLCIPAVDELFNLKISDVDVLYLDLQDPVVKSRHYYNKSIYFDRILDYIHSININTLYITISDNINNSSDLYSNEVYDILNAIKNVKCKTLKIIPYKTKPSSMRNLKKERFIQQFEWIVQNIFNNNNIMTICIEDGWFRYKAIYFHHYIL